jgi:tRNA modification GTPase
MSLYADQHHTHPNPLPPLPPLRLASQELGRVTGRVDVEELLDIIFRDFCIGK